MQKKLTVILLNAYFARNWLESEICARLTDTFNVSISIPDSVNVECFHLDDQKIKLYRPKNIEVSKNSARYQQVFKVKNRSKSTTFKFRLRRHLFGDFLLKCNLLTILSNLKFIRDRQVFLLLSFLPFFRIILTKSTKHKVENDVRFESYIPPNQDLVLIPFTGTELEIFHLLKILKKTKVVSILIVENWDNLSSKSALIELPDFITVAGSREAEKAKQIHGFKNEQIIPIGLPRFDIFRDQSFKSKNSKHQSALSVLYLGFSIPHDEITILNELVEKSIHKNLNFRFIYRPHPAREVRLKEPELRKEVILQRDNSSGQENFGFALKAMDSAFIEELSEIDFVIAPPTTMLLEILLLKIPCILDLSIDGKHRTSAGLAYKKYLHMKDLELVNNLAVARSSNEMISQLSFYKNNKIFQVDYDLSQIVDTKPKTFINQLVEFLSLKELT